MAHALTANAKETYAELTKTGQEPSGQKHLCKPLYQACNPTAVPEWQAVSLGWRSRGLMVACPLEGCGGSVASLQATTADLRLNGRGPLIQGVTKGILCLP